MFHNYTLNQVTKGRKLENSPISRAEFRQIHTQSHAVRDARFHLLSWSEPVYISAAPWQRPMPVSFQKTSLFSSQIHPSIHHWSYITKPDRCQDHVFLSGLQYGPFWTLVLALIWDYRLCTYSMKKVIL